MNTQVDGRAWREGLASQGPRPRPRLGARRRHRAGRRIHGLELFGRQGRRPRGAHRLLGRGAALHLRGHDRLRGDVDRGGRRRPIRPGQAHRRPLDGLQCRHVPGHGLYDARGQQRHHDRRPDPTDRQSRGLSGRARQAFHRAFDPVSGLAELPRRLCHADLQPGDHGHRVRFGGGVVPRREALDARRPEARPTAQRTALRLVRRHRGPALRPVVLSRHRGHHARPPKRCDRRPAPCRSAPWPA